jgi:hypothetical protein
MRSAIKITATAITSAYSQGMIPSTKASISAVAATLAPSRREIAPAPTLPLPDSGGSKNCEHCLHREGDQQQG